MAWLMLGAIGLTAAAALFLLGVSRQLWTIIGCALLLGATGYALQGRPALPGHPVSPDAAKIEVDPGIVDMREAMMGRFSLDAAYQTASDAMLRAGSTASAANVLIGGIRKIPDSTALWTSLGGAIEEHDGAQMSPATLFAFRHAMRLSPKSPGPPFFLGLAYVRAGDFAAAKPAWERALALTRKDASYREGIEVRLALLNRFLEIEDRAAKARTAR